MKKTENHCIFICIYNEFVFVNIFDVMNMKHIMFKNRRIMNKYYV